MDSDHAKLRETWHVSRMADAHVQLFTCLCVYGSACAQISRKLTKVKERAINKGTWPGKAGPKEDVDTADYEEAKREVRARATE